jgi:hypothetical protein
MALLDPFVVADSPLQSVQTEVYIAIRADLQNDATRLGSGKPDDPFDGSKVGSTYKFDTIVATLPAGSSILLGPGTFPTQGTTLLDGMRLAGAGRAATTIKLDTGGTSALGSGGAALTGVEVRDLSIDCQQQGGAINIIGVNNSFRNLEIINWAPNTVTSRVIVQIANVNSSHDGRNCLVENCLFDNPGTIAVGASATLIKLAGSYTGTGPYTYYAHEFCTVRGCQFYGNATSEAVTGIDTGLGRGFVAEDNQFENVQTGIYCGVAALDVIAWNNLFYLVEFGISLNYNSGAPAFGRAIIQQNDIVLPRGSAAQGILVTGSGSGQYFGQVVVRNNEVSAEVGTGSTSLLAGIQVFNTTDANIENNVVKDYGTSAGDALSVQNCINVKAFNNLDGTGQLLNIYSFDVSHTLQEVEDYIEDSLLGI